MDSDSDKESMSGEVEVDESKQQAHWGKTKYDYYYTDYVDKDYPTKLTAKEERLAAIEQEEALRIQKKLLSTIDDANFDTVIDLSDDEDSASSSQRGNRGDLIEFLQQQNQSLQNQPTTSGATSKKRKRVTFEDDQGEDSDGINDDDGDEEGDEQDDEDQEQDSEQAEQQPEKGRERRPINMAMQKNRGLTPYKKKEYRNPRVKHKLKFKKAMSKRRRNVQEAKTEFHRYSGEASGIKTSTIKSIKLC